MAQRMRLVTAAELDEALDFPALIDALAQAFCGGIVAPQRHHHAIAREGHATATHLLMPAWTTGEGAAYLGAKIVNVFPDNARLGLSSVSGVYLLQSGVPGSTLAALDGGRQAHWNTTHASAT